MKGGKRTFFGAIKEYNVVWTNSYLPYIYLLAVAWQTITPGFDLTKRVSPKPLCCTCIQPLASMMGAKNLCRLFVYSVILIHRAHATGYAAVSGKVHQSIGQELRP